ncbi:MAG TPA: PINc/VapC family ATPase [Candidatus Thermoplasmatota archaeon]|nr:PINc/VapC family ATPase [Candidatus Thermoplasmatota archaeon]
MADRPRKAAASKAAAKPKARATPKAIVPDTSVIVDGRITRMIQENELSGVAVYIPLAVVAELEYQANQGRESGFEGLDEIVKIQQLREAADLTVEFVGDRPTPEEVELAGSGEIDALIRDVAEEKKARLITSDRIQAHVARAMHLDVQWLKPISEPEEARIELEKLELMRYFDENTMSVHLKNKIVPMAKKGRPGEWKLTVLRDEPIELKQLTRMRREIIETARRDQESFIEIERNGATVVQLRNLRITIAQPPFAETLEITAVRPVTKLNLENYQIGDELKRRLLDYQRGVFVSGPPGSGKSTFVTAIAEWLKDQGTIVKTMESPRDLQVSDEITQYAPLEGKMELTSDVLLLVRPDFVVYDEVRKTEDFEIFGDMRLAGVGLVGVTHANRAIDAVQRLIGRVELGMIPQVVDTVIHIEKGKIKQVLELHFTVKTPHGMTEADLARPVIQVRDFTTKSPEFEIYTYGEQVVVMPVRGGADGESQTPKDRLAAQQVKHMLRGYVEGNLDVEWTGEASIALYAEEWEVPRLIGRGGKGIQQIEGELGLKIDVRPLTKVKKKHQRGQGAVETRWEKPRAKGKAQWERMDEDFSDADEDEENESDAPDVPARREPSARPAPDRRYAEIMPELRKTKKNLVLILRKDLAGNDAEIVVDDDVLFTATIGAKGEIRVARRSDFGQALLDAVALGKVIRSRV